MHAAMNRITAILAFLIGFAFWCDSGFEFFRYGAGSTIIPTMVSDTAIPAGQTPTQASMSKVTHVTRPLVLPVTQCARA